MGDVKHQHSTQARVSVQLMLAIAAAAATVDFHAVIGKVRHTD